MWSCERVTAAVVGLAGLAGPARAADSGRLDLLAAEAARLAATPSPVAASPVPWLWIVALFAGTMLAAFLGTYAGARRQLLRGGKDWRELTYRFRSGQPLRLKQNTLARLNGLLGDLEEIGTDLKKASGSGRSPVAGPEAAAVSTSAAEPGRPVAPPAPAVRFRRDEVASPPVAPPPTTVASPPAAVPRAPSTPPRRDRRGTYERARRLLEKGHDAATIRELTGLKTAELDLLRAAPAGAHR